MSPRSDQPRERISLEHFMNLSAEINYHLSAKQPNLDALLALVLGPAELEKTRPLVLALQTLMTGYGHTRRKIGPLAVLHPLRTAALLARSMEHPTSLDLMGALLHDVGEDLQPEAIPEGSRTTYQNSYARMLSEVDAEQKWYLGERIDLFTRRRGEEYHSYLVGLLDHAPGMPDLIHVKLADRLDNTLDHHIHRPGVLQYNFYRNIFDLLFVPVYSGVHIRQYHSLPDKQEGALLLSQLFKNAVFLSLIRHEGLYELDTTTKVLCDTVAVASIREAQWIGMELLADSPRDLLPRIRELVLDTMEYCYGGGATEVHASEGRQSLDGLFLDTYATANAADRKQKLADLFEDRNYLGKTILTFIAAFAAFLNDSSFSIDGIDREGIRPV